MEKNIKKPKIGILFICTGLMYWQYASKAIEGARKYLLPNNDRDFFLWSDIEEDVNYGATVFETEALPWPYPTLMRYHMFLQQEEILEKYDYLFYCDIDMEFVDIVGDEILADGITATEHPMYHLRPGLQFPLEPNPESSAYIQVPNHYFAGGFQGGKTKDFLKAMKWIKRSIDKDFTKNYVARWNDESHWNRYLFDNPPAKVLDPSYCYPDSMIDTYYVKIWGRNFKPKLKVVDKKFSFSKEGGEASKRITESL